MSNPLFNSQTPNPFGNVLQMMSEFNKFKNNFQGNPEQQVRSLLQSGQMTEQQFQQFSEMAKNFRNMMR